MAIIIGGVASESLIGDPFGVAENDIIFGNGGNDDLVGLAGNDLLFGGAGADNLGGNDGSDTLEGGIGADILDGFGGSDWLSYAQSGGAVQINLAAGTAAGADAAGDVFFNFENLAGSGFGDQLIGNAGFNGIVGGAGADRIIGGAGNDTLNGGLGGDRLTGGAGNDVFRYFDVVDSPAAGPRDVVTDFLQGADVFGMQGLDASIGGSPVVDVLNFIGHNVVFNGVVGEVRGRDNGANSFVDVDTDGDAIADLIINVAGVTVFNAGDFVF